MTEEQIAKLPKCHFCKQPVGEGQRLKHGNEQLYLCDTCRAFLSAIIHDCAYGIFEDLTSIMASTNKTWEERLEPWLYTEEAEKI